jgi:hypothetical protein
MQLRTAQKVGVILTFGLGIINLTVCITRFLLVDLKNEVIGQTTLGKLPCGHHTMPPGQSAPRQRFMLTMRRTL